MGFAYRIRLGAWLLIGLNLLMAFGSIGVFLRMAPAIEIIIERNDRSLRACEAMLVSLAMPEVSGSDGADLPFQVFEKALADARENVTEPYESEAIAEISRFFQPAFQKDDDSLKQTLSAILRLSDINRAAMVRADQKAKQLGTAGAWGIVFMAIAVFLCGLIFVRSMVRGVIQSLLEITAVMAAFRSGDTLRRCTHRPAAFPREMQVLFSHINALLDRKSGR